MAFGSVGINLPHTRLGGTSELAEDLEALKDAAPDFVEVCPHRLGTILGGKLDARRTQEVAELLLEGGFAYTVHAPHRLNLMDPTAQDLQRDVLDASLRFARGIGARVVVCHAGRRVAARDARHGLKDQLAAERRALRELGDTAAELGVVVAVENFYPVPAIAQGTTYAYSVRPSELAEQVGEVDHPAVGICLDVGHASVAANLFGFGFVEECAAAAPLVRHLHLHDNLGRPDPAGEPLASERHAYGLGDLHLPPGRGSIPLGELLGKVPFPETPTCCVELSADLHSLAAEAIEATRELGRLAEAV